ncbi:MAG: glycosyl hydrolase, partial [Blastocatellia bacterium]|nr:glycosyl hydrolase [Blastocatellia bacterium]
MYKEAVRVCLTSLLMLGFCLTATEAQVKVDSNSFSGIEARSIGPATMSGRILAIDAINNNPQTLYVGAAGGGVWKSTNGGTTFKPIFEKNIQSIGAITIDQSKPDTVWVGTGEADTRNSVSVGNGLYKTTDGGENWTLVGLEKSERISRILIDPKKSDTIYVSVVGNLWNDSEDRGLYKTTDGGKTWEKILYVDAKTGCSDIAIDPQETNTIYAGMWQFRRLPYIFTSGGSGSGLHKSTDGGKTWKKLTSGLPEGELGRIAIAVAPSRPNVVYANVEAKKTGLYRSDDMGETWRKVSSSFYVTARPFYFSHLYVDPKDYNKVYKTGFSLGLSRDGGVSFGEAGGSTHSDHHALWIDPNNTSHLYLGTDGGVYETQDSRLWTFLKGLPVSQFYHVSYDMKYPYNVYGGLQDNGSWVGPSTSSIGVRNKDWKNVGFGDGFYTFADPNDPNIIYSEWQGGRLLRYHRNTGELKAIQPFPKKG